MPTYPCTCQVCETTFSAKAPHAGYCSRKCRLQARNDRLHGRKPLKKKGVKMNKCLGGRGCTNLVYPPMHICRGCKDRMRQNPTYADQWGAVI